MAESDILSDSVGTVKRMLEATLHRVMGAALNTSARRGGALGEDAVTLTCAHDPQLMNQVTVMCTKYHELAAMRNWRNNRVKQLTGQAGEYIQSLRRDAAPERPLPPFLHPDATTVDPASSLQAIDLHSKLSAALRKARVDDSLKDIDRSRGGKTNEGKQSFKELRAETNLKEAILQTDHLHAVPLLRVGGTGGNRALWGSREPVRRPEGSKDAPPGLAGSRSCRQREEEEEEGMRFTDQPALDAQVAQLLFDLDREDAKTIAQRKAGRARRASSGRGGKQGAGEEGDSDDGAGGGEDSGDDDDYRPDAGVGGDDDEDHDFSADEGAPTLQDVSRRGKGKKKGGKVGGSKRRSSAGAGGGVAKAPRR